MEPTTTDDVRDRELVALDPIELALIETYRKPPADHDGRTFAEAVAIAKRVAFVNVIGRVAGQAEDARSAGDHPGADALTALLREAVSDVVCDFNARQLAEIAEYIANVAYGEDLESLAMHARELGYTASEHATEGGAQ